MIENLAQVSICNEEGTSIEITYIAQAHFTGSGELPDTVSISSTLYVFTTYTYCLNHQNGGGISTCSKDIDPNETGGFVTCLKTVGGMCGDDFYSASVVSNATPFVPTNGLQWSNCANKTCDGGRP